MFTRKPRVESLERREVFSVNPLLVQVDAPVDSAESAEVILVGDGFAHGATKSVDASTFLERFPDTPLEEFSNGVLTASARTTYATPSRHTVTKPVADDAVATEEDTAFAANVDAVVAFLGDEVGGTHGIACFPDVCFTPPSPRVTMCFPDVCKTPSLVA